MKAWKSENVYLPTKSYHAKTYELRSFNMAYQINRSVPLKPLCCVPGETIKVSLGFRSIPASEGLASFQESAFWLKLIFSNSVEVQGTPSIGLITLTIRVHGFLTNTRFFDVPFCFWSLFLFLDCLAKDLLTKEGWSFSPKLLATCPK